MSKVQTRKAQARIMSRCKEQTQDRGRDADELTLKWEHTHGLNAQEDNHGQMRLIISLKWPDSKQKQDREQSMTHEEKNLLNKTKTTLKCKPWQMCRQLLNASNFSEFNLLFILTNSLWLQDSGYASGFSARRERDSKAQSPSQPCTGVLLL